MTIPEAAIEAAREALDRIVPNSDGVLWDVDVVVDQRTGMTQPQPVTLTHAARAAIEAAMPAIREAIAQDWQQGQWADALAGTQRPTQVQTRLATAQAVTDWLRDSAAVDVRGGTP